MPQGRSAIAFAAAFALALSGCDLDGSSQYPKEGGTLAASPAQQSGPLDSKPAAKQLLAAAQSGGGGGGGGGEPVLEGPAPAGGPDALFDGADPNKKGGEFFMEDGFVVPDPSWVPPSGAASSSKSERWFKLGAGRKPGLRTSDVPTPNTLPAVQLPKATERGESGSVIPLVKAFMGLYDKAAQVFDRDDWNAGDAKGSPTKHNPRRVTVHHTAGAQHTDLAAAKAQMRTYQRQHWGQGWSDIGYHFVVDGAGRVFEGRHADVLGSHSEDRNKDNIGISLMGNYQVHVLKDSQKATLRRLITFLALKYRTDPSQKGFIEGHQYHKRDIGEDTSCPGKNVLGFLKELRKEVDGETEALVNGESPDGPSDTFKPLALVRASGSST